MCTALTAVAVVAVALWYARKNSPGGVEPVPNYVPQGFEFDPYYNAYTKVMPDGSRQFYA
jgi:hypothetical protein